MKLISHLSASSVGKVKCSTGAMVTSTMWRASRLVDSLAKLAAASARLPTWLTSRVASFAKRLGVATHGANNYKTEVTLDGGKVVTKTLRDSTAERPQWRGRARQGVKRPRPPSPDTRLPIEQPPTHSSTLQGQGAPTKWRRQCVVDTLAVAQRKRVATGRRQARADSLDCQHQVARRLRERGPTSESTAPPASARLEALKDRLRTKGNW